MILIGAEQVISSYRFYTPEGIFGVLLVSI